MSSGAPADPELFADAGGAGPVTDGPGGSDAGSTVSGSAAGGSAAGGSAAGGSGGGASTGAGSVGNARARTSHGRTTITFYLSDNLRNRARAAYRSTSFHEKDASWSEMLTKALLAEVERRERAHNRGQRFPGSEEPLNPGRPIGY
jgi:hypothetical protein